jgi:hypothetical protein
MVPVVSQDVTQFMAKLIGALRPGTLADVDDNPGHAAAIGCNQMAGGPDVCSSTCKPVGWQSETRRTCTCSPMNDNSKERADAAATMTMWPRQSPAPRSNN